MSKKFTLKDLAFRVLKEEGRPLTALEIWEIGVKKGYDKLGGFKGKKPWLTIGAIIHYDIKENPDTIFVEIDGRPRKYFLKDSVLMFKYVKDTISKPKLSDTNGHDFDEVHSFEAFKYSERDLHPLLAYFAYNYLNVYTKTIHHEKSNKRKYTQWLHPDMVGVYFPIEEWRPEVLDFAKEIGSTSVILYSFEIKKELGFHNLRESFFQAVSNSSWANEGYLVTANLDENDDLISELKRLSASFGIGIIKLNIENPDSSKVFLPSKRRDNLDWDTINKLASENPDFREFLKRIKIDLSSKEIRKEMYDKVYSSDELVKRIKKL